MFFFSLPKSSFSHDRYLSDHAVTKTSYFLKSSGKKPKNSMLQADNSDFLSYSEIINVSLVTLMFHFDYK